MMMMRRLKGFAAVVVIVAMLIGTPMLLLALGSNPLSGGVWPTWAQLARIFTAPDDGSLLLGLIKLIAWIAWLVLAVLLMIEIGAALRGVKAPALPGLAAPQGLFRTLVATAALLFLSAPLGTGISTAQPAQTTPAHGGTTTQLAQAHTRAPIEKHTRAQVETRTVVKGDTLWEIADDELGDGARYPEIFKASKKTVQPGGHRLSDPDEIDIGWKLTIPRTDKPAAQPKSKSNTDSEPQTSSVVVIPTQQSTAPPTPASAIPTPVDTSAATVAPTEQANEGWITQTAVAGVGTLLAAGVVALLRRRRRIQQQHRRPGAPMPLPTGSAAATEQQLRAGADPLSVDTIDRALRALAAHCRTAGQPLPDVRAARLTSDAFDLYLTEPADLPAPWTDQHDRTVWTLQVDDQLEADQVDHAPSPYPALVTLGHDEEAGHVLINLEQIGGLTVSGDTDATREILAAIAVELGTSMWADDLTITVVAAFAELDLLGTGRIRYVPSITAVLDDLEARATADRAALSGTTLNEARTSGIATDSWTPDIVIIGAEMTKTQSRKLTSILEELPRVAIAAVSATSPIGQWQLTLDPNGAEAVLDPIGLALVPQRLPAAAYSDLLEATTLSDVDELDPTAGVPDPTPADISTTSVAADAETIDPPSAMPPLGTDTHDPNRPLPAALRAVLSQLDDRNEDAPGDPVVNQTTAAAVIADPAVAASPAGASELLAPRISVLGPVTIQHANGPVERSRQQRLLELAAYLVLNPGATHSQIDDAIWPNRRPGDNFNTRNPATTKLRRWLGTAPDGTDYLPRHQSGYSLHSDVSSDVTAWHQLVAGDAARAGTEALEKALRLVRGVPFEGVDFRRRYAWAEPLQQQLISEIVDVSYELTRRRILEGRWRAAEESVVVGLRIQPAQESLWRLRILAAHESGNKAAEAEAIDRLSAIMDTLECDLDPETIALLDKLQGRTYAAL